MEPNTIQVHLLAEVHSLENFHCIPLLFGTQDVGKDGFHQAKVCLWSQQHCKEDRDCPLLHIEPSLEIWRVPIWHKRTNAYKIAISNLNPTKFLLQPVHAVGVLCWEYNVYISDHVHLIMPMRCSQETLTKMIFPDNQTTQATKVRKFPKDCSSLAIQPIIQYFFSSMFWQLSVFIYTRIFINPTSTQQFSII